MANQVMVPAQVIDSINQVIPNWLDTDFDFYSNKELANKLMMMIVIPKCNCHSEDEQNKMIRRVACAIMNDKLFVEVNLEVKNVFVIKIFWDSLSFEDEGFVMF